MLKDFEITRGLRHLSNGGSGSPPTLPQFLKACRQHDPDDVVRPGSTMKLPPPGIDRYTAFGNRTLLGYLMEPSRINPSEASLQRMVAQKNRIMQQCREIEADEEMQSSEIANALRNAFDREYEAMPQAEREAARQRFTRTSMQDAGAWI